MLGELSNLDYLKISGNSKLHCFPDTIGKLHQLTVLVLEDGCLTSLPESIGELRNLRELIANRNQLTQLPESIGNLHQLENLEIQNNQLTGLPENIGKLSMLRNDIYLYGNPLNYLPDSILQLPVELIYAV